MGVEIYRFTGDNAAVRRSSDTEMLVTGDVTIAAFIRNDASPAGDLRIMSREKGGDGYYFRVNNGASDIYFWIAGDTAQDNIVSSYAVPSTNPGQGVVCVFNGSEQKQRVFQGTNAKDEESTTETSIVSAASQTIEAAKPFGAEDIVYASNMTLINRAWTDQEARSFITTGGVLPNWEDVLAYLPCNEKKDGESYSVGDSVYNYADFSKNFAAEGIAGSSTIKSFGGLKTSIRRRG